MAFDLQPAELTISDSTAPNINMKLLSLPCRIERAPGSRQRRTTGNGNRHGNCWNSNWHRNSWNNNSHRNFWHMVQVSLQRRSTSLICTSCFGSCFSIVAVCLLCRNRYCNHGLHVNHHQGVREPS